MALADSDSIVCCSVVWFGVMYSSVVWVWCGVVWCGLVWCGVVWCDGVSESLRKSLTSVLLLLSPTSLLSPLCNGPPVCVATFCRPCLVGWRERHGIQLWGA